MKESYDLVVVGTGFASSFFLNEYLKQAPDSVRVLVLEKGEKLPYAWKLKYGANANVSFNELFINHTPAKGWLQNIAFGGGACWTGNTPRFLPSDFALGSQLGIGVDWPITYSDLEPYYVEVETLMGIAGSDDGPYPRSQPYSCPPHPLNAFDRLLVDKYPGQHIAMPSVRSSNQKKTGRPQCCANGPCSLCPITAKFQVDLHFTKVYEDPRVKLLLESSAERLLTRGDIVYAVKYKRKKTIHTAECELIAVGAHALLTPFLLLRSGFDDPVLGRYLNEQIGVDVQVNLNGVDNYDGGQGVTGWGTMLLEHDKREEFAGCAVEGWNVPWLRAERGRWRQRGLLKLIFEDIPQFDSRVFVLSLDAEKPHVSYAGHSEWLKKALSQLDSTVESLLEGLPVEDYSIKQPENGDLGGAAHIQGTFRMGADAKTSVVDANLVHHRVRNLIALGSGVFPSCPAGNPTLTLSALAVRAARSLFEGGGMS